MLMILIFERSPARNTYILASMMSIILCISRNAWPLHFVRLAMLYTFRARWRTLRLKGLLSKSRFYLLTSEVHNTAGRAAGWARHITSQPYQPFIELTLLFKLFLVCPESPMPASLFISGLDAAIIPIARRCRRRFWQVERRLIIYQGLYFMID